MSRRQLSLAHSYFAVFDNFYIVLLIAFMLWRGFAFMLSEEVRSFEDYLLGC